MHNTTWQSLWQYPLKKNDNLSVANIAALSLWQDAHKLARRLQTLGKPSGSPSWFAVLAVFVGEKDGCYLREVDGCVWMEWLFDSNHKFDVKLQVAALYLFLAYFGMLFKCVSILLFLEILQEGLPVFLQDSYLSLDHTIQSCNLGLAKGRWNFLPPAIWNILGITPVLWTVKHIPWYLHSIWK